ncbi:F-box/kelch-repeat protein At3g23880-like [Spinacia oleracea]|uniref:F-box/kelch-repeat protein At3g23880-like n=1 Tax=Spinacia oleracea TaxID=3562 RepID=A0ABM3QPK2_SPIOL|nr:F-box/kelch-repeat protein At3g23880-like [Spinacia oleracea]
MKRTYNKLMRCNVLRPELDLPPELWTEVLARLPAKTLVRFRTVCRAWCSTIDKPEFFSKHLSLYKNNTAKNRLLVLDDSMEYSTLQVLLRYKFTLTTTFRQKMSGRLDILGYCNGLVLLSLNCGMYDQIKLLNPSIQKSTVLPRCPGVTQTDAPIYIIGFVPSSNEYKVAAFRFSVKNLSVSISIYSFSDHLWRTKTAMIDFPVRFFRSMGYVEIYKEGYCSSNNWKSYYSHGAVYWLVSDKKEPNQQSDEYEPVFEYGPKHGSTLVWKVLTM